MRALRKGGAVIACSFCDKAAREIPYLVQRADGPEPRPAICNECLSKAAVHMAANGWVPTEVSVQIRVGKTR